MEINLNDEAFGKLQELEIEEMQSTSGGLWPVVIRVAAAVIVNAIAGVREAHAPGLPGPKEPITIEEPGPVLHPCDAV